MGWDGGGVGVVVQPSIAKGTRRNSDGMFFAFPHELSRHSKGSYSSDWGRFCVRGHSAAILLSQCVHCVRNSEMQFQLIDTSRS